MCFEGNISLKLNKIFARMGFNESIRYLYNYYNDDVNKEKYIQYAISNKDYKFIYNIAYFNLISGNYDLSFTYFNNVFNIKREYLYNKILKLDNIYLRYLILINLPHTDNTIDNIKVLLNNESIKTYHDLINSSILVSDCCICFEFNLCLKFNCNHYVCIYCYPKIIKLEKCPICRYNLKMMLAYDQWI